MTLPFFPQETPDSCVPACLRMVMNHLSIQVSEQELRQCCQTTHWGTDFREAATCAERYGLNAKTIMRTHWTDLLTWLAEGIYPIISVNLFPLEAQWTSHAVIVESAGDAELIYLDPLRGQRQAIRVAFEQAWQMRQGKALIVDR